MTTQNIQRGMSYDPAEAKRQREAERIKVVAILKERNKAEHRATMREHGRMLDQQARDRRRGEAAVARASADLRPSRAMGRRLDQIEQCYREYTPIQVHSCKEMVGDSAEALFDAGLIEWRGDLLCEAPQGAAV